MKYQKKALRATLEEIRSNLSSNKFKSEENIRVQVVLRVLQSLGWDIWNPDLINFESNPTSGTARVDVFLRTKARSVVIEVKRAEMSLDGKPAKQLLKYNDLREFSIGFLTNGREWRGYYIRKEKENKPEDLLFAKVDLIDSLDETQKLLMRFLSLESIESAGKGIEKEACHLLGKKQAQLDYETQASAKKRVIDKIKLKGLPPDEAICKKLIKEYWKDEQTKLTRLSLEEQNKMVAEILGTESGGKYAKVRTPPDKTSRSKQTKSNGKNDYSSSRERSERIFAFKETQFPFQSWTAMLVKIAEEICREKGISSFYSTCISAKLKWIATDSLELAQGKGAAIHDSGIVIGTNGSKEVLGSRARKLLEIFGYSQDTLEIPS